MKRKFLLTLPSGTAMAFVLSLGAVGCMITGFDLSIENGNGLVLFLAAASAAISLLFLWDWGSAVAGVGLILLGVYLWWQEQAAEVCFALLNHISHVYNSAYNWGVLAPADAFPAADLPMALIGLAVVLSASRTVCRGKGTWLTALLSGLPLAICMVVTDTVPDVAYLLTLLAGLVLLILTAPVRNENPPEGNRLLWLLALPVVLALGALFHFNPQETYVNQSRDVQQYFLAMLEEVPQKVESAVEHISTNTQPQNSQNVDLKTLGRRPHYTYPVMDVTSQQGGILYLRGQDYDSYTGTGWAASSFRAEDFGFEGEDAGTVHIRTRSKKDFLYLPYYPNGPQTLAGGMVKNTEGRKEYSWNCAALPANREEATPVSTQIELTDLERLAFGSTADRLRYVTLPGETDVRAKEILKAILPEGASRAEAVQAIADYVKNSAEYDLATDRMPPEEADFALWFLSESETGYCVHFATAAVVLLRAADIPARYVTGYMVSTQPGETVTATAANAHAWAEYYVPQLNTWVILEATPAEALYIPAEDATVETDAPTPVPETDGEVPLPVPTEGDTTVPTTAPTAETTVPEAPEERESGSAGWLLGLLIPLLAVGQYPLRLRLWEKLRRHGNPNRQALRRWQEAEILAKLRKTPPPEVLLNLAQKAKFSQHILTAAELEQFDSYRADCILWMKQQSWYRQLAYRLIWAVY